MIVTADLFTGEHDNYQHALEFATAAHGKQLRKYTGLPYVTHVIAVAGLVATVRNRTIEMIQAALLHDVLEDTDVTAETLICEFGSLVTAYVLTLTDPPLSYGNREKRKAAVCARMLRATWAEKTIKLADLIDNTSTIVEHDPDFAPLYLAEKSVLLDNLIGGDQHLWNIARGIADGA